jgi:hypothetical protein
VVVAPLSPRRYEVRVTVDDTTHEKLRQLQDLLAHTVGRDPAVIVARAIEVLHEKTLARKAAVTKRPRRGKPATKRSRHIPAAVKRTVWARDGARCAFVDDKGRRCSATSGLEFHHIRNWARGAGHAADEIELRCHAHYQFQAVLDYGPELVRRRRGARPARASRQRREARPLDAAWAGGA